MIRFYSIFVTDDDLLASHYVRRYNIFHDLTLHRGKVEIVNFLLQSSLTKEQREKLNVMYDPLSINLLKIDVRSYLHQTLLTAKIVPKELGSIKIGFSFPESANKHVLSKFKKNYSPLDTKLCSEINEHTFTD